MLCNLRPLSVDCACVQVQSVGVPDNARPPRHLVDPDSRPPLGVRALMSAVEDFVRGRKLVGARIAYKRNARGEHVVAIIFPAQPP
jgi:hypothetical protein